MINILNRIFNKKEQQPEDYYTVTITETFVRIEHPERATEEVKWQDIEMIKLINTDQGPWLPDVWLALLGKESGCLIPQGAEGFDEVYETVSQYPNFNFENTIKSMSCTDNAEFDLWSKE
jgi:hypothetical protein